MATDQKKLNAENQLNQFLDILRNHPFLQSQTDVISESIFKYSMVLAFIMLYVPYYIPVMMMVTLIGASFIEALKYIRGCQQNYSVWRGIGTCTLLGYLAPCYLFSKLVAFFGTFDPVHLDFTGDICKKPSYYEPIAYMGPVFLVGSVILFYPLYFNDKSYRDSLFEHRPYIIW